MKQVIEKKGKNTKNDNRTCKTSLRFTQEEYDKIKQKANELNVSFSRAIFILLEKAQSENANENDKYDILKQQLLAFKSIRSDFKKISQDYSKTVSEILSFIAKSESSSQSLIQLRRGVENLQDMTIELQKSLNQVSESLGQKKDFSLAKTKIVDDNQEEHRLYKELTNMERIMINGHLAADASVYNAKDGANKLRFKVTCEGADKSSRTYLVFYSRTDKVQFLKKDCSVFVEGKFMMSEKGDLLIMADVVSAAVNEI